MVPNAAAKHHVQSGNDPINPRFQPKPTKPRSSTQLDDRIMDGPCHRKHDIQATVKQNGVPETDSMKCWLFNRDSDVMVYEIISV